MGASWWNDMSLPIKLPYRQFKIPSDHSSRFSYQLTEIRKWRWTEEHVKWHHKHLISYKQCYNFYRTEESISLLSKFHDEQMDGWDEGRKWEGIKEREIQEESKRKGEIYGLKKTGNWGLSDSVGLV